MYFEKMWLNLLNFLYIFLSRSQERIQNFTRKFDGLWLILRQKTRLFITSLPKKFDVDKTTFCLRYALIVKMKN